MKDSDPFVGEAAQSGLVRLPLASLLTIVGGCPERLRDGERSPFDEGLPEERGALPAPVHPDGVAATFSNRGNTGVALQIVRAGKALALLAESCEESGSEDGVGRGKTVENREIRMRGCTVGYLLIEGGHGIQRRTQLLDQSRHKQGEGLDDALVVRQSDGALCAA